MKNIHVLSVALLLAACSKKDKPVVDQPEPGAPEMIYTDLKNTGVKQGQSFVIDLDKDGTNDIAFGNWYIGKPSEHKDEVLFFTTSYVHSQLLMDTTTESTPRFNNGEKIPFASLPEHHQWYVVSLAELTRKNIPENKAPYWDGLWKQADHQYIAVLVQKQAGTYAGWVEVSVDTNGERLVLHKAAISKIPGAEVRAGK
ncbi:MAG: hypothetical protein QM731_20685 [Chitinophagaceae bacterium]